MHDTITMTATGPAAYRYTRPRETLAERVRRLASDLPVREVADLAARWAARAVRRDLLGADGRAIAAAASLAFWHAIPARVPFCSADVCNRYHNAMALLDSRERAARQGV